MMTTMIGVVVLLHTKKNKKKRSKTPLSKDLQATINDLRTTALYLLYCWLIVMFNH
jgi:hypothetical protein